MAKFIDNKILFFSFGAVFLVAASSALAVSGAGMKACEVAVLQKPRFQDLPMAAVSVYPGKKQGHAHFTVNWDGLKAEGNCKLSGSYVDKINVKNFHDGRGSHGRGDWDNSDDLDGFYYDKHQGKWRDPAGRVCHTCTPENGFSDHSRGYHYDYRPKNEYERHMQKDMRNMLSDEDIRNLNILTDDY